MNGWEITSMHADVYQLNNTRYFKVGRVGCERCHSMRWQLHQVLHARINAMPAPKQSNFVKPSAKEDPAPLTSGNASFPLEPQTQVLAVFIRISRYWTKPSYTSWVPVAIVGLLSFFIFFLPKRQLTERLAAVLALMLTLAGACGSWLAGWLASSMLQSLCITHSTSCDLPPLPSPLPNTRQRSNS